jgi:hypothetical protein
MAQKVAKLNSLARAAAIPILLRVADAYAEVTAINEALPDGGRRHRDGDAADA